MGGPTYSSLREGVGRRWRPHHRAHRARALVTRSMFHALGMNDWRLYSGDGHRIRIKISASADGYGRVR